MAWKESRVEEERFRFMEAYRKGILNVTDLCRCFEISRKTAYKWIHRYRESGLDGLKDQSRAPLRHPNEVLAEVRDFVLEMRRKHPTWGPRKLYHYLEREGPEVAWPAPSTIGEMLRKAGMTQPRRRRRRATPNAGPLWNVEAPNQVWCADFKGWFRCQDGSRCDPLTITDARSRYLLRCQIVRPDSEHCRPVFASAFREFGLPEAIRTDNGAPFAGIGIGGLSRLSVWWIKLGIRPERIRPGQPQENGQHERMHRTLNQETTQPPAADLRQQQKVFRAFCWEYNQVRPHEALQHETPAAHYSPSPRPYPKRVVDPTYPRGWEERRIRHCGDFKWCSHRVFVSSVLRGELVGLEPVEDGIWVVWFGNYELGRFEERARKVHGLPRVGLDRSISGRPPGSLRSTDLPEED